MSGIVSCIDINLDRDGLKELQKSLVPAVSEIVSCIDINLDRDGLIELQKSLVLAACVLR